MDWKFIRKPAFIISVFIFLLSATGLYLDGYNKVPYENYRFFAASPGAERLENFLIYYDSNTQSGSMAFSIYQQTGCPGIGAIDTMIPSTLKVDSVFWKGGSEVNYKEFRNGTDYITKIENVKTIGDQTITHVLLTPNGSRMSCVSYFNVSFRGVMYPNGEFIIETSTPTKPYSGTELGKFFVFRIGRNYECIQPGFSTCFEKLGGSIQDPKIVNDNVLVLSTVGQSGNGITGPWHEIGIAWFKLHYNSENFYNEKRVIEFGILLLGLISAIVAVVSKN